MGNLETLLFSLKITDRIDSGDFGRLQPVVRASTEIEGLVASLPSDSRLTSYLDFYNGYLDGLQGISGTSEANTFKAKGRYSGLTKRDNILSQKKAEDDESPARGIYDESLSRYIRVATAVKRELELLVEAKQNPYGFLMQWIEENNKGFVHISNALKAVLSHYWYLTTELLHKPLSEDGITQLEKRPDSLDKGVKLGIFYLFNRQPMRAHIHLTTAFQMAVRRELKEALRHVYDSILAAYSIVNPASERIKLAKEF
ncbi:hypothetical protein HYX02_05710 [Candidatus Woesearchaeota archaeon]|nr:hypothetical protein [Candidatus Woesearchaeota archaeon]